MRIVESDERDLLKARDKVFSLANQLRVAITDYIGEIDYYDDSDSVELYDKMNNWLKKFKNLMQEVQDF